MNEKPPEVQSGLAASQRPAALRKKILLVEDHAPTRSSLGFLLGRRGFTVIGVGTVEAALGEASRQAFDVVLSDIGLPDGNGFALMRLLAQRHGLTGIALTGYDDDALSQSTEAGFTAHLTKPIDVRLLDEALAKFFLKERAS